MQFDRTLRAAKLRPVEDLGTQLDHRGVHTDELVLETEPPAGGRGRRAAPQQCLEHPLIELPRAMLVGVGQCGPGRCRDPQMGQLALAAGQPAADFPQRVRSAELAEQHRHELAPAGEAPGMALAPVGLDQRLKFGAWEELEQLAEDAGESLHGWPPSGWGRRRLAASTAPYRRRSSVTALLVDVIWTRVEFVTQFLPVNRHSSRWQFHTPPKMGGVWSVSQPQCIISQQLWAPCAHAAFSSPDNPS